MIARLTGTLEAIDGLSATIALHGGSIAYEVMLPAFLAERLAGQVGKPITLTTFEYLESQGQGTSFIPRLIGFQRAQEREFFELFTTVKGIGNRKALRAMSAEPAVIARAIVGKDTRELTKLPEIGKRMAETVVAELTGKVDRFLSVDELAGLDVAAGGGRVGGTAAEETVLALMALGETRGDAEALVSKATARARRDGRTVETADGLLEVVFSVKGG